MHTLQEACIQLLIKYKSYIGNIGELPIQLLDPVLEHCTAVELLTIEDNTSLGGRRFSPEELARHWRRVYLEEFGNQQERQCFPQLGGAAGVLGDEGRETSGQGRIDWKERYQAKCAEHNQKAARVGLKVRKMWEEEKKRKDSRCIQVIDSVHNKQQRPLCQWGAPSPSKGRASPRERLAKKLRINPISIRSPSKSDRLRGSRSSKPTNQLVEHDIDWGGSTSKGSSS